MNDFKVTNYFTYDYKKEVSQSSIWGHHFAFLNVFLLLFISIAYLYNAPHSNVLGLTYLLLSWLGHSSCLVFIVYLLLFFPLIFIGKNKAYQFILIILATLLHLILLVDVKLYISIGLHLNFSVLDIFFEQEGFYTGLNFNFLGIATPIIVSLEFLFAKMSTRHVTIGKHPRFGQMCTIVFLISFVLAHVLNIWADYTKYQPILQYKTTLPAYYPTTANTFLARHGWINENQNTDDNNEFQQLQSQIHYPLNSIQNVPVENPYNFLLILVNGVTNNAVNAEIMPNLHSFALKNHWYKNHYLGTTNYDESLFELSYGIPAQYYDNFTTLGIKPIILNEMRQQDYKVQAFISNSKTDNISSKFTKAIGLKQKQINTFNNDKDVANAVIKSLLQKGNEPRPTTTIVSLNSAISNYPQNSKSNNSTVYNQYNYDYQEIYNNNLKDIDENIKLLLNTLDTNNILDNTVVMITSTKPLPNLSNNNTNNEYIRENYHAPLIIHWPDDPTPSTYLNITSTQDITPTIAKELLGVLNPYYEYSTGTNLRNNSQREWILSGSEKTLQIIAPTYTIMFDKHGNANIYSESEDTPTLKLSTLVKAMKILNQFKDN